jgi:hypothetical protein
MSGSRATKWSFNSATCGKIRAVQVGGVRIRAKGFVALLDE